MITSGLVITLSADPAVAAQAIAMLSARSEFSSGERNDRWLPVAMEAHDDVASRDLHDWLGALPGVEFVDVVSVSFDDEEKSPTDSEHPQRKEIIRGRSESAGHKAVVSFPALND